MSTENNREILIVGVVNLTPDSFWSGSRMRFDEREALIAKVEEMLCAGAGMIDLGACSTRPGSFPPDVKTEWERLEGALREISRVFPRVPLSIDTFRSEIVRKAVDVAGELTVNDISAGEADPEMLPLVSSLGLRYVAMHHLGSPLPGPGGSAPSIHVPGEYPKGVTNAVVSYFEAFSRKAEELGIKEWMLDPGFGFSKTVDDNWTLAAELPALRRLSRPVYVGVSRKSMLTRPLGITAEEALGATSALHLALLLGGADVLRVHDVVEAARVVEVFKRLSCR